MEQANPEIKKTSRWLKLISAEFLVLLLVMFVSVTIFAYAVNMVFIGNKKLCTAIPHNCNPYDSAFHNHQSPTTPVTHITTIRSGNRSSGSTKKRRTAERSPPLVIVSLVLFSYSTASTGSSVTFPPFVLPMKNPSP